MKLKREASFRTVEHHDLARITMMNAKDSWNDTFVVSVNMQDNNSFPELYSFDVVCERQRIKTYIERK